MTITINDLDLANKEEVANVVRMLSTHLDNAATVTEDEPKPKRTRTRKAKTEEPKTEEPKTKEPKTKEPKTEEPDVERGEVVALAKQIAGNGQRDAVKKLINEYAPKLSEVPDDKLGELYTKLLNMQG